MAENLREAALGRRVGIGTLHRIHALIREEAAERRRILIFTRYTGFAALLGLLLLALSLFGARL